MDKIAVLIPCYNEGKTIQSVINNVRQVLPEAVIYVFDNFSTDDTVVKAQELGVSIKTVKNRGKGNVVREMFKTVDAECYIMVDGDNTYDLTNIRTMVEKVLDNKVSMVVGVREFNNSRFISNLGNKILRQLVKCLYRFDIKDVLTGFRAFSRDFVKSFPSRYDGFEVETEMTVHAITKENCYIEFVDTFYWKRQKGSVSKIKVFDDGFKIISALFRLYIKKM